MMKLPSQIKLIIDALEERMRKTSQIFPLLKVILPELQSSFPIYSFPNNLNKIILILINPPCYMILLGSDQRSHK